MKERDAEISRLLGELRRCQAQLQIQQVMMCTYCRNTKTNLCIAHPTGSEHNF